MLTRTTRRIYLCNVKFLDVPLSVFDMDHEGVLRADVDNCLFIETNDAVRSLATLNELGIQTWLDIWFAVDYLGNSVSKLARP